ncbi:MAG: response regulator [Pseudomonadota bacterium]
MKLDIRLTTKARTRIHHLGLDAREALVIESILKNTPALAAQFVFGPAQPDDDIDLLFVNGDDPAAVGKWETLRRARAELVGILVSSEDPGKQREGMGWLRRPLALRDSLGMIQAITGARTGSAASAGQDHVRVLVVDDSFPARQYMKLKLQELAGDSIKLAVDFAESGAQAVDALRESPYDLAFIDVVMPGMDGYEVCRQLKQIRPLRVAMLTGQNAYLDFQNGKSAGCDHYLTKPPHDADLRSVLRLTSFRKITAKP